MRRSQRAGASGQHGEVVVPVAVGEHAAVEVLMAAVVDAVRAGNFVVVRVVAVVGEAVVLFFRIVQLQAELHAFAGELTILRWRHTAGFHPKPCRSSDRRSRSDLRRAVRHLHDLPRHPRWRCQSGKLPFAGTGRARQPTLRGRR